MMAKQQKLTQAQINGHNYLLTALLAKRNLKNDRALAKALEVPPPAISKIRHGRTGVTADFILRVHERLDLPVADIRHLMQPIEKSGVLR